MNEISKKKPDEIINFIKDMTMQPLDVNKLTDEEVEKINKNISKLSSALRTHINPDNGDRTPFINLERLKGQLGKRLNQITLNKTENTINYLSKINVFSDSYPFEKLDYSALQKLYNNLDQRSKIVEAKPKKNSRNTDILLLRQYFINDLKNLLNQKKNMQTPTPTTAAPAPDITLKPATNSDARKFSTSMNAQGLF